MPAPKKQATVFYAWQMDRADEFCKVFIMQALKRALSSLNATSKLAYHLKLDHSTLGIPGWSDIPATILEKIRESDVIVADLTHVATTEERPEYQPKKCPNSNVVFELGYAFHALGTGRLILVANEFYGTVVEHFFDIHHRRHPIRFRVGPDTSPAERRKAQESLKDKLITTIRNVIQSHGTSRPPALHHLYSDWWETQNEHRVSTWVRFEGLEFWVEEGVFSPEPRLTNSSSLVARKIPLIKGKKVLDLGTGSGALAVLAALRGADRVVAVDTDPRAVNNARRNMKKHKVEDRVTVIEGNLFDNVTGTFDLIIANLPIDPRRWEHVTNDVGEMVRKFLREVRTYLAPKGLALLPWASFGEEIGLTEMMKEAKVNYQIHTEETFGVTWQIYEIREGH